MKKVISGRGHLHIHSPVASHRGTLLVALQPNVVSRRAVYPPPHILRLPNGSRPRPRRFSGLTVAPSTSDPPLRLLSRSCQSSTPPPPRRPSSGGGTALAPRLRSREDRLRRRTSRELRGTEAPGKKTAAADFVVAVRRIKVSSRRYPNRPQGQDRQVPAPSEYEGVECCTSRSQRYLPLSGTPPPRA